MSAYVRYEVKVTLQIQNVVNISLNHLAGSEELVLPLIL